MSSIRGCNIMGSLGKINWEDLNPFKLVALTSFSVICETGVTYPLWTIKTHQQVDSVASSSVRQAYRNLTAQGGVKQLYRGFGTYATCSIPSYAAYVTLYNYTKSALGFESGFKENDCTWHVLALAPMVSGLLADIVSLSLYIPVDLCVQRLQVASKQTSLTSIASELYSQHGIRGFFKGSSATIATSGVISSVWWLSYENLKKAFQQKFEDKLPQHQQGPLMYVPHVAAGAMSSIMASSLANPLDVLKTRIQVLDLQTSLWNGLKVLIREEGLLGAFKKGLTAKLLMVAPLGAISSFTYELVLFYSLKDSPQH